jgi:hypothetical protein
MGCTPTHQPTRTQLRRWGSVPNLHSRHCLNTSIQYILFALQMKSGSTKTTTKARSFLPQHSVTFYLHFSCGAVPLRFCPSGEGTSYIYLLYICFLGGGRTSRQNHPDGSEVTISKAIDMIEVRKSKEQAKVRGEINGRKGRDISCLELLPRKIARL